MIAAACEFLDHLECLHESGGELPTPFVMRRIHGLLTSMLQPQSSPPALATTFTDHRTTYQIMFPGDIADSFMKSEERFIQMFREDINTLADMNTEIYVDIQCLNSNKGCVIKEFSVTCVGGPTAWILVKCPFDSLPAPDSQYVSSKLHGITWDTGYIDNLLLRLLTNRLFSQKRPVFVKGRQKVDVLVEMIQIPRLDITSLEDVPKLKALREIYSKTPCPYHQKLDSTLVCTTRHVKALVAYLKTWT